MPTPCPARSSRRQVRPAASWLVPAALLAALLAAPLLADEPPVSVRLKGARPQSAPPARIPGLPDASAPLLPATIGPAGNEVYRLYLAEDGGNCGTWTATTGSLHPEGAGRNVLYGDGNPGTSDTSLRSWTTGLTYRTGGPTTCTAFCDEDSGTVELVMNGAVTTGYRMTWIVTDGPNQIEFIQEINVEGPVGGTQTVDNSVIRETHTVHNLGPGQLRFGLRKHWDWQIAFDDGPWFATCDHVDEACDASLEFHSDGSGDGVYSGNYVINEDPASSLCPAGVSPIEPDGCDGSPIYIVAGTVAPPSSLVPAPDAPEILQFNSWNRLVDSCWLPTLDDNALCGSGGSSAGDDTAIGYFYGASSGTAIVLAPGEQESFTQYVVAASRTCPAIVEPPDEQLACSAGGPYAAECTGPVATFALDGSTTGEAEPPSYSWTTDCPGGSFDDPGAQDPILTLDAGGCSVTCSVTLLATTSTQSTTCTAAVTVTDTIAPVISCPGDLVVECRGGGARLTDAAVQAWIASVTATDACTSATILHDIPSILPIVGCSTQRVVTFRALDDCNNQSTCQRLLTVVDTTPPTVTCPVPRIVECGDPNVAGEKQAWLAGAVASDSCSGTLALGAPILVSTDAACGGGTETYEWTAVDGCGLSATCRSTWTVVDAVPPSLSGVPADSTVECGAVPGPAAVTASDTCDATPTLDFTEQQVPGTCPQSFTVRRTWTTSDDCGNTTSQTQVITVRDTQRPTISALPAPSTIDCLAAPVFATPTAGDACDPAPGLTFADVTTPGPCAGSRDVTRTWTATDACGNTTTASQVIHQVDTTAPAIGALPGPSTIDCPAAPSFATPSMSDACDPAATMTFADVTTPGACAGTFTRTRTWTAVDGCGNSSTASQIVTVRDITPPTISALPGPSTVDCPATPSFATPSASDTCDASVTLTFADVTTAGACAGAFTTTRTWTALDDCGNSVTASQTITVRDVTAPTISALPAPSTIDCPATPSFATPTATDTCDASVALTFADVTTPGACAGTFTTTRTWTALDDCGNTRTASQSVTVRDNTAPTISALPAPTVIDCPATPSFATPTASDACDPVVALTFADVTTPGSCAGRYSVTRTWTAADACGNTRTASQTIAVQDGVAPVLTGVPASATVECDAVPAPAAVGAADACDPAPGVVFAETRVAGSCPNRYQLRRMWTATDACGNASSATQVLDVDDTTPPIVNAPASATVECPAPAGGEAAWLASATATDTCGPATVQSALVDVVAGCGNTVTRIHDFWARDACGLESARVRRSFAVVDTTPPTLSAPPDLSIECPAPASGPSSEAAWLATATASDTCGTATVQSRLVDTVDGCGSTFAHVHELWAVDACGNESARVLRRYAVVDTTPPVFSVPGAEQFHASIWPPNHGYVVFSTADVVSAGDSCGTASVRATGCSSSQPEDVHQGRADDGANGDGHTVEDCVVSVDGASFAVRAERLGACGKDSVRTYELAFVATDECGNDAPGLGTIVVEHDRSGHQTVGRGRKLGPNDPPPFPYLHPTVYGPGCE